MTERKQVRLLVCVGPRCDAEGRGRVLLARVEAAAKAAFPDELASGRLAFSTRDCLRLCTRDPVARIEPSGDAFSDPGIDELLRNIAEAMKITLDPVAGPGGGARSIDDAIPPIQGI